MTRGEWRWPMVMAALVMGLTFVPYAAGWAHSSADWHFNGFVFGLEDGNSYIAKMALGARGAWLFHLFYTTEPHRPGLVYSFPLWMGKLATLVKPPADSIALHDRFVAWYHGARLLCGFALLLVTYRFCAEFLPLRSQRRLAFFLIALGGGLGWLWLPAGGRLPLELYSPEAFTFLNLYGLPHLAAARCFMLMGMLAYLRAISFAPRPESSASMGEGRSRSNGPLTLSWLSAALTGGAALFLTGMIQPLYLIVCDSVLAAHLGVLLVLRRPMRQAFLAAALMIFLSAPMIVYTALIFQGDPIWVQWQQQNIILSPPPVDYLLGWGLWLLPAIIPIRHYLRLGRRSSPALSPRWFLIAWLLVVPLLLYLPYNLQRRFAEGAQLPIVCLAVIGLTAGLRARLRRSSRRGVAALITGLSLPGTLLLLAGGLGVASRGAPPVFVPRDQIETFRWLGRNAAPDGSQAVLASFQTGNILPAYAPVSVHLGHGSETAYSRDKVAEVDRFFATEGTDEYRLDLLQRGGIDYVMFDHAAGPADFDPSQAGYLEPMFSSGEVAIYRVKAEPAP